MKKIIPFFIFLLVALFLSGCIAKVDRSSARAHQGVPEVSQTQIVSIPKNPHAPTYVVAIEQISFGAADIRSGGQRIKEAPEPADSNPLGWLGGSYNKNRSASAPDQRYNENSVSNGIKSQLITALINNKNIKLIEEKYANSYKIQKNERGPFVIKGTVTEFSETVDANNEKTSVNLGSVGLATGLIGAFSGIDALSYVGLGTAVANPGFNNSESRRTGIVAIDLHVIDIKHKSIISAIQCSGSFTTVSAESGMSIFGIGKSNSDYAASAIGQAIRVAVNDANVKINDEFIYKIK